MRQEEGAEYIIIIQKGIRNITLPVSESESEGKATSRLVTNLSILKKQDIQIYDDVDR